MNETNLKDRKTALHPEFRSGQTVVYIARSKRASDTLPHVAIVQKSYAYQYGFMIVIKFVENGLYKTVSPKSLTHVRENESGAV